MIADFQCSKDEIINMIGKLLYSLSLFIFLGVSIHAQTSNKIKIHTVAFYNLENLFDTINDPLTFDESSPIMELKTNKEKVYWEKIKNMAEAISQIGKGINPNPPSLIGVCEVENKKVLEDLILSPPLKEYNYNIVHFDSKDSRGIDVALLYRQSVFVPKSVKPYEVKLMNESTGKREYTRDQLWISGLLDDDLIFLNINHWPSRRGGEIVSQTKRSIAAQLTKRISDSLFGADPYSKIIIMGDFNDNPTDFGLSKVLGAKFYEEEVKLKSLFNVFGNQYLNGNGTHAYLDSWGMFDQIILSAPWLDKTTSGYRYFKGGIFNPTFLVTNEGKYRGYPFRSFGDEGFTGGYSDHFPVFIYVIKEAD